VGRRSNNGSAPHALSGPAVSNLLGLLCVGLPFGFRATLDYSRAAAAGVYPAKGRAPHDRRPRGLAALKKHRRQIARSSRRRNRR
jgi:hypothetical protein